MSNLLQFYYGGNDTTAYTGTLNFDLSAATISRLSDEQKENLLGTSDSAKGMITLLKGSSPLYANASSFEGITSIKINEDFSKSAILTFDVSAVGINATLTLTIKGVKSVDTTKSTYTLYAGTTYSANASSNNNVDLKSQTITNKIQKSGASFYLIHQQVTSVIGEKSNMAFILFQSHKIFNPSIGFFFTHNIFLPQKLQNFVCLNSFIS